MFPFYSLFESSNYIRFEASHARSYDVDEQHVSDLEFHICGMVGQHLTRAYGYVRQ